MRSVARSKRPKLMWHEEIKRRVRAIDGQDKGVVGMDKDSGRSLAKGILNRGQRCVIDN